MYFLEKTDCSNSNPPFITYFEDPDLASFVYTIEEYPSSHRNPTLIFTFFINYFLIIALLCTLCNVN